MTKNLRRIALDLLLLFFVGTSAASGTWWSSMVAMFFAATMASINYYQGWKDSSLWRSHAK